MNTKLIAIFVALVLLLASFSAVAVTSVSAQESAGDNTTTSTTTEDDSDGGDVNISVGSIIRPDGDGGTNDPDTVLINLGNYGHVYDIKYDRDDEFVTVYFSMERTAPISLADANFETPAGESYASYHNVRLPSGESKIKIQNDRLDNQQCIALNGAGTPSDQQIIYCDNDRGGETLVTLTIYIGSLLLTAVGAVWGLRNWFKNQSVDGPPRNSEGVPLPDDAVYGDVEEVESDE
jgi:hypothetical protein